MRQVVGQLILLFLLTAMVQSQSQYPLNMSNQLDCVCEAYTVKASCDALGYCSWSEERCQDKQAPTTQNTGSVKCSEQQRATCYVPICFFQESDSKCYDFNGCDKLPSSTNKDTQSTFCKQYHCELKPGAATDTTFSCQIKPKLSSCSQVTDKTLCPSSSFVNEKGDRCFWDTKQTPEACVGYKVCSDLTVAQCGIAGDINCMQDGSACRLKECKDIINDEKKCHDHPQCAFSQNQCGLRNCDNSDNTNCDLRPDTLVYGFCAFNTKSTKCDLCPRRKFSSGRLLTIIFSLLLLTAI